MKSFANIVIFIMENIKHIYRCITYRGTYIINCLFTTNDILFFNY